MGYRNRKILGKKLPGKEKEARKQKMEELKASFEFNLKRAILEKLDYK